MFNRSAHVHKEKSKGRDNTLGRHCANRAPLRRQGASAPTRHSNFLNRKTVCPIVSTWNIMATAMGQGTEGKQNKMRQGSKQSNYDMLPRLIGRDPRTASSSSNLRIPLHPLDLPHSPEASNLGARANEAIAALNRIALSGTYVNTRCANRRKNKQGKTLREERETTTWITEHGST